MRRLVIGAVLALLAAALPARAQEFPSRDIRFICGFAPGGTCDLLSRFMAEHLSPILGQRVVVENRTGASGNIAADLVAKAPPDGHTVLLATMALYTVMPQMPGMHLPFDVDHDLTPISNLANITNVLVVSPQSGIGSVAQLVERARAKPGGLSYASAGNGGSQHLAAEMFKRMAGVELLHVPYRGGAPAIVDIAAGRTDMMFGNLPEFLGQIRGGGLRVIAYGAPQPSPLFPELPAVRETVPGFEVPNWFGVAGPGGMPPAVLARWVAAVTQVNADPVFQQRLRDNGMTSLIGGPDAFRADILRERQRWGEVIRAANIRAD